MATTPLVSFDMGLLSSSVIKDLLPILRNEFHDLSRNFQRPEDYLTRQEAADILGISLPTLDKYTKKGILTKYQLENTDLYRYRRSDIEFAFKAVRFKKGNIKN